MKLFLFALLLSVCLLYSPVDATPSRARRQRQSNSGMVTMPLKRHHVPRDVNLHPQVLLQHHINHASRRLARMTGREEPSEHVLHSELHKRLHLLESGSGSRSGAAAVVQGSDFSRRYHNTGRATTVVSNGTVGTGNVIIAGGAPAYNGTNTGVSPLDIQAANNSTVTVANQPTANNSLGLDIEANDLGYLITIQIGTPPRDFTFLVDLGVAGENCHSCGNHTSLGPRSSKSFIPDHQTAFYIPDIVVGDYGQDNVTIAGLVLDTYKLGVASDDSSQLSKAPFDGIMGLGLQPLSKDNISTPVQALATNNLIQHAIASFKTPRLADQLDDGEVTFGGLDATKFDPKTLVTIPNVNQRGLWEGTMDAITINDIVTSLVKPTALFDTSIPLILTPPQHAQYVMERLGGTCNMTQCTIPCTTQASLALSFGNASFAIDPRDLAILPINPTDPTGNCTAGIQPNPNTKVTQWLVGDVFLKNVYLSVNYETCSISLAKLTTPS